MVRKLLSKIARRVWGRSRSAPDVALPVIAPVEAAAPSRKPDSKPGRKPEQKPDPRRTERASAHAERGADPRRHGAKAGSRRETDPAVNAPPEPPWTLDAFVVEPKIGAARFHDFDLPHELMRAIHALGFHYCTPIQAKVLGPAMRGRHIMGQAQTGTGKTAAFLLTVLTQFLRTPLKGTRPPATPRALVIAPTRELVIQIANDAEGLSRYCPCRCVAVYGGMDFDRQARALQGEGVDIIAATPGRLLDFVRRGILDLRRVEVLVIDEADRMLDMGFIPDVRSIIRHLPPHRERQTLLFSATLSEDVRRLASQWMDDPVIAEVAPEQVAVDTVKQLVYAVSSREKFTVLYNLLKQPECKRVLVFGNRRDSTLKLADYLLRYGIQCGLLSGAIDQNKRLRILEDFKSGRVNVLVATDVAGRGLHVDEITHVVNFDFPYEADDYVHRIGRTGRAGAEGTAISFACEDESFIIPEIENYIGVSLPCRQPEAHLLAPLPAPVRGAPAHQFADDAAEHAAGEARRGGGGRPAGRRGPPGRRSGPPRRGGPSRPRR